MSQIDIIEARAHHCGQMSRHLRHEHQVRLMSMGLDAHRAMRQVFDASSWRRAGIMDGKLIGIGGVIGSDIAATGYVWMALTERAKAYPVLMTRTVRGLLDEIMLVKRELATCVLPEDDAALRMAVFLGFHTSHQGPGSPAFSRMGRRNLMRHIINNTELHSPTGVAMGYHRVDERISHIGA